MVDVDAASFPTFEEVAELRRHLRMRIGAPWNLDETLNGKTVQLPATTGNVVVTPADVSTLKRAPWRVPTPWRWDPPSKRVGYSSSWSAIVNSTWFSSTLASRILSSSN